MARLLFLWAVPRAAFAVAGLYAFALAIWSIAP